MIGGDRTPGQELQSSWEVLPLDPPGTCGGRAWAGSSGRCGHGVLRAVGWEGSLGQVLAKGPEWASGTLGPGDLDPSSLELRIR